MKKIALTVSFIFFVFLMYGATFSQAENTFAVKILEYFPQADTNKDGVLSEDEEAAVSRRAIQRYPKADVDGDGSLSDKEKEQLLKRVVALRKRMNDTSPPSGGFFGNAKSKSGRKPSFENVKYGENERNVFDIWLADSETPTPLAVYIHGGGFKGGSKEKLKSEKLNALLDAGISVAAINYRLVTTDPLPTAHHDARRAIQFMRSKADEWNIDTKRVAAFGGSAGAQICMWLAYSDDMADATSDDPVERESTRLLCVATAGGQTSAEREFYIENILPLLGENVPVEVLVKPLNGENDPEEIRMKMWGADTLEEVDETTRQCSALRLISPDDPPIFMSYGMAPDTKKPSGDKDRVRGWLIHHVVFGTKLKEKADELGVEADLSYPGSGSKYSSDVAFFRDKLLEGN
ncbi:MAG TPA: lipase [Planctomycetaceae bacterium]|nr:lipase [Planctomycetaceae bacterium]|tara:strand:- start:776 stop:1993 length:1218 start_codon:yes stop_codon:yes gene_type:complete